MLNDNLATVTSASAGIDSAGIDGPAGPQSSSRWTVATLRAQSMPHHRAGTRSGRMRRLCLAWVMAGAAAASAAEPGSSAATQQSLRASHAALLGPLSQNDFMRPLVLQSEELPERLAGHIHAVLSVPFERLRLALSDPAQWCELLSLHINTKYCRPDTGAGGRTLMLYAGKKTPQTLASAMRVDMAFAVVSDTPDLLAVDLQATTGPLGTSDSRVALEAIPLTDGSSYLHLTYSTATHRMARLAMQAYLATAGRDKVGFTRTGTTADGQAAYLAGTRGAIERNTMRYFLAIDSYLASTQVAPAQQLDTRLQSWFSATEAYPRQLHEMDRKTYVAMKRAEHQRQQAPP